MAERSLARRVLALLAATGLATTLAAAPGAPLHRPQPRLSGLYDDWLDSVAHLATDQERALFSELRRDLERERFIRGFWQARGNAALERYRRNSEAALELRHIAPDKHRVVLIAGKPRSVDTLPGCRSAVRRFEVWHYDPWSLEHQTGRARSQPIDLLFVQASNLDGRSYRLWSAERGVDTLAYADSEAGDVSQLLDVSVEQGCLMGPARDRLAAIMARAPGATELLERLDWAAPDPGWLERFRADAAALPPGAAVVPGIELELDYPGSFGAQTIVHGRLRMPIELLERITDNQLLDRVTIVGDIYQRGRLAESFEVIHHIAGAVPRAGEVRLDFYRSLRPGEYQLRLRAVDRFGLGLLRSNRELGVPELAAAAPPPAGHRQGFSALTRSEVIVLTTLPSVEILPPDRRLETDDLELEAITTGGPIGSVRFLLDGIEVARDEQPPFTVHLQLEAESHELVALALDPAGRELARDTRVLERESAAFWVEIGSPVGEPGSRHVPVALTVPDHETLKRVDCYLGETHTGSLRTPPFGCTVEGAAGGRLAFVRAVATLASGESVEDVLFLSPGRLERVEVRLVELYVSVLDPQGRPVTGLGVEDFEVIEDGERQEIRHFDTLQNLPLNVAVLMDTSSSLGTRVRTATASAQRFFRDILTPRDLATLLAFNHDIRLLVPWTDDVQWLEYGANGLRAWGSTRLNDSIVYALHLFGGRQSRRALVVLTDGSDVGSDFPFEQVLLWAVRSGVALYPIALGDVEPATRADLGRLAEQTGGSHYAVRSIGQLDAVYRRIAEELRSQYLLAYRPSSEARRPRFRDVEVRLRPPGLSARSVRGYYP